MAAVGRPGGLQRLSDLAGGSSGGGQDVLVHGDGAWLRAAGGTEGLCTHLGPVRTELETAHEGLSSGTSGLTAPAELRAVRESWARRFEAARGECGALAGKLRDVVQGQRETNETVKESFTAVGPVAPVAPAAAAASEGGHGGR